MLSRLHARIVGIRLATRALIVLNDNGAGFLVPPGIGHPASVHARTSHEAGQPEILHFRGRSLVRARIPAEISPRRSDLFAGLTRPLEPAGRGRPLPRESPRHPQKLAFRIYGGKQDC
jgi:hypothetical protein